MDKIFIFVTPEGSFKLCQNCNKMVKAIAENAEVVKDEETAVNEDN
jgi:hypothetical protein